MTGRWRLKIVRTPFKDAADDAERIIAGTEEILGCRFDYFFKKLAMRRLPEPRPAFLSRWIPGHQDGNEFELLSNGNKLDGQVLLSVHNLPISAGRSRLGFLEIEGDAPALTSDTIESAFVEMVRLTDAWSGTCSSPRLSHQRSRTVSILDDHVRRASHPAEVKFYEEKRSEYKYVLRTRKIKGCLPGGEGILVALDWINYWCDATAEMLGFPNPTRDAELGGLYERCGGGWVLKLTQKPLDLDVSGHLERLQWAYDRFGNT